MTYQNNNNQTSNSLRKKQNINMNISNELLNALLNYLSKEPYIKSFQLINSINKEMKEQREIPDKKTPELREVKK